MRERRERKESLKMHANSSICKLNNPTGIVKRMVRMMRLRLKAKRKRSSTIKSMNSQGSMTTNMYLTRLKKRLLRANMIRKVV